MVDRFSVRPAFYSLALIAACLACIPSAGAQVNFGASALVGESVHNPTSLQFGPDDRLYVLRKNGLIDAMTIVRLGPNDYTVAATEEIALVKGIPNHDDDGAANPSEIKRQATGLLAAGTAANPVLYVASSDPRAGAGGGADLNLDTNSGVISRLTWTGGAWDKVDLVLGLPRSEENHATNGLQLSADGTTLYASQGGHTNAGAPSNSFAFSTEYALSAAILSIDLVALDALPTLTDAEGRAYKYDLPTLDDPTRANANGIADPGAPGYDGHDVGDPWGGNDGLNQALLTTGGPVQVYSPGWRNAYDLVVTTSPGREGRMYTIDNGGNGGWGGHPAGESDFPSDPSGDPAGACTNEYLATEPGSTSPGPGGDPEVNNLDNLHFVTGPGYYGGHPNPVRGNPAGAGLYTYDTSGFWRTGPADLPAGWPPVPAANPIECDFRNPGETDGALYTWENSTNGLAEYTASNFTGALQGNLLAVSYDGVLYRAELNAAGDAVTDVTPFASSFGAVPLDVTAQGDDAIFPGTVWAVTYIGNTVAVFEPADYEGGVVGNCSGTDDDALDEDSDGYDNADEIASATDPCSAASLPPDHDGDFTSDLNDADDDNDGIVDSQDAFARDPANGLATLLPIDYPLFNDTPGTGFFGLGFTGLMADGTTDYLDLYDPAVIIAGGAAGLLTLDGAGPGDAVGTADTQETAFQFGVATSSGTAPFTVAVRLLAPFFDGAAVFDGQAHGAFIGTGTQDDFLRIALVGNGGDGGLEVRFEAADDAASLALYGDTEPGGLFIPDDVLAATALDVLFSVDPAAGTVQPRYAIDGGAPVALGAPIPLSGALLAALQSPAEALAIGVAATAAGGAPFTATWDFIGATLDPPSSAGAWTAVPGTDEPTARHESAFVQAGDAFVLLGGRGNRKAQAYDFATQTWENGTSSPIPLHHFQAVALDGLVYAIGAYTGDFPTETALDHVWLYDPIGGTWLEGAEVPAARRRGSAGAVVYQGQIYMVAGSTGGHGSSGTRQVQFDAYNPYTGAWTVLPDAPTPRDHVQAAVVGDRLYVVGGRDGSLASSVTIVDVYDFAAGTWSTLAATMPTPRSASAVAVLGTEILVMGGESNAQQLAHAETEAFDTVSQTWRSLAPLLMGRHGTQAIASGGGVFVAAGSGETGGGPELSSHERFGFSGAPVPSGDALTPSALFHSPETLSFGIVAVGQSAAQTVTVSNTDGDQALVVTGVTISGSPSYALAPGQTFPFLLAPGASAVLAVEFTPADESATTAQLLIQHTGTNPARAVSLSGGGGAPGASDPLFRVNAGGKPVADPALAWGRDTQRDPSTYVNASGGGNTGRDTSAPIANATGAPDGLFTHYRWDEADAPELAWAFPVAPGTYQVLLYFAELDPTLQTAGARVFDVEVEGAVVLSGYDVFAAAGARTAIVERATVAVTDGTLDVTLLRNIQNPFLSAIEVRGHTVSGPLLVATPGTLDFGARSAGTAVSLPVTLSNPGDESLDVTAAAITGADSLAFSTDAAPPFTLAAGASRAVAVTYTPLAEASHVAALAFTHSAGSQPLAVPLIGASVPVVPSVLAASDTLLVFGDVGLGTSATRALTLANTGGTTAVTVTALALSGSAAFAVTPPALPIVLAPGEALALGVAFAPTAEALYSGQLDVTHDGANGPFAVGLSGQGVVLLEPLFRVNAGGKPVADPALAWGRDTQRDPSAYVNAPNGGNTGRDRSGPIANATGAPDGLFTHYRWDEADAPELAWAFPVDPGLYEVRLYFAELDPTLQAVGARVFDVEVEGAVVLSGYDVFAAAGARTAVMETATVAVTDDTLTVRFVHGVQHPAVAGLEILPAASSTAKTAEAAKAADLEAEPAAMIPDVFALHPAWPNPSRGGVTFAYDLPEAAPVTLTLYTLLGQRIAVLVDAQREAGTHTLRWEGRLSSSGTVASGVYLFRMQAGRDVATGRFTWIR